MAKVVFTDSVFKLFGETQTPAPISFTITNEFIGLDLDDGTSVWSIFQNGLFEGELYSNEQSGDVILADAVTFDVTNIIGYPYKGLSSVATLTLSGSINTTIYKNADDTAKIVISNPNQITIDTVDSFNTIYSLLGNPNTGGGSMTGPEIESTLDNYYGNTIWRQDTQLTNQEVFDAFKPALLHTNHVNVTATEGVGQILLETAGGGGSTDPEVVRVVVSNYLVEGAGITFTDNGTTTRTISVTNEFTQAERDKLNLIEDEATADQTGPEIVALVNAELGGTNWQSDTNTQRSDQEIRDIISAAIVGGVGITVTKSPSTFTFDLDNEFTAAEKSKLDGIEPNAKDDQTASEIEGLYEGLANTNKYTDAEKSKLGGIEPQAKDDQTGPEIQLLYEAQAGAWNSVKDGKLTDIEPFAKDDQTGAEIVALINTELGQTGWQVPNVSTFPYQIDNGSVPSSGDVSFGNFADQSATTSVRVHKTDDSGLLGGGDDISGFLGNIEVGDKIALASTSNTADANVYEVTAIVDSGDYFSFSVTLDRFDAGNFSNNEDVLFAWQQAQGTGGGGGGSLAPGLFDASTNSIPLNDLNGTIGSGLASAITIDADNLVIGSKAVFKIFSTDFPVVTVNGTPPQDFLIEGTDPTQWVSNRELTCEMVVWAQDLVKIYFHQNAIFYQENTFTPEGLIAINALEATGTPLEAGEAALVDVAMGTLGVENTYNNFDEIYCFAFQNPIHHTVDLKGGASGLNIIGSPSWSRGNGYEAMTTSNYLTFTNSNFDSKVFGWYSGQYTPSGASNQYVFGINDIATTSNAQTLMRYRLGNNDVQANINDGGFLNPIVGGNLPQDAILTWGKSGATRQYAVNGVSQFTDTDNQNGIPTNPMGVGVLMTGTSPTVAGPYAFSMAFKADYAMGTNTEAMTQLKNLVEGLKAL